MHPIVSMEPQLLAISSWDCSTVLTLYGCPLHAVPPFTCPIHQTRRSHLAEHPIEHDSTIDRTWLHNWSHMTPLMQTSHGINWTAVYFPVMELDHKFNQVKHSTTNFNVCTHNGISHCSSLGRRTTNRWTDRLMWVSCEPLYCAPGPWFLYLRVTSHTSWSQPGLASTTSAIFHWPLMAFESCTSTMSPTLMLRFAVCHFCSINSVWK